MISFTKSGSVDDADSEAKLFVCSKLEQDRNNAESKFGIPQLSHIQYFKDFRVHMNAVSV